MKTIVLVFTKNNARFLTNPENLEELAQWPNVVINPDCQMVNGVPPHFWKLQNGFVYPMTEEEKAVRLKDIEEHGIDNELKPLQYKAIVVKNPRFHPVMIDKIAYALAGLAISSVIYAIILSLKSHG